MHGKVPLPHAFVSWQHRNNFVSSPQLVSNRCLAIQDLNFQKPYLLFCGVNTASYIYTDTNTQPQNFEKSLLVSLYSPVCLSNSPSVRPHGRTQLPLDGFSWNLIFDYSSKICREFQFSLKSDKNIGTLHKDLRTFVISHSVLFTIRNVSDKSYRENKKTLFCSITFFPKILSSKR